MLFFSHVVFLELKLIHKLIVLCMLKLFCYFSRSTIFFFFFCTDICQYSLLFVAAFFLVSSFIFSKFCANEPASFNSLFSVTREKLR